jgi:hypothetical protein
MATSVQTQSHDSTFGNRRMWLSIAKPYQRPQAKGVAFPLAILQFFKAGLSECIQALDPLIGELRRSREAFLQDAGECRISARPSLRQDRQRVNAVGRVGACTRYDIRSRAREYLASARFLRPPVKNERSKSIYTLRMCHWRNNLK